MKKYGLNKMFFVLCTFVALNIATAEAQVLLSDRNNAGLRKILAKQIRITPDIANVPDGFAEKHRLLVTPEIADILLNRIHWELSRTPDESLYKFGVEDRSQLSDLQLGKPIAHYRISCQGLRFVNTWQFIAPWRMNLLLRYTFRV